MELWLLRKRIAKTETPLGPPPSMRRPVTVKVVLFLPKGSLCPSLPLSQAASDAILPSALFVSDDRSVQVGAYSFQQVLLPDYRPRLPVSMGVGPGVGRRARQ